MKFLHISDIHFDPANDGEDTVELREKFEKYVNSNNISVDEVFFTGDFRHAKNQNNQSIEEISKGAVDFLTSITYNVVNDKKNILKHIHIVPGNHDLDWGKKEDIKKIYEMYDDNKANFKEQFNEKKTSIDHLLSRFEFFEKCAELLHNEVWQDFKKGNPHKIKHYDSYSTIYLNSVIAYGEGYGRGSLLIGRQYLNNLVRKAIKINGKKPIFILSHNIIDDIEIEERRRIKNFLDDNEVPIIWFCGDTHNTAYNNSYNVAYITAGSLVQERGTEASFFVGEFKESEQSVVFDAHGYDSRNSGWERKGAISERINKSLPVSLQPRTGEPDPHITYLPVRNKYFTGRNDRLKEIDLLFGERKVVNISQTISGLGGIGKTQLAIEYAYRYGRNYKNAIWFVLSDSTVNIYNDFVNFAGFFNIKLPNDYKEEDLQMAIKNWLSDHEGWLIIFDNVEFFENISLYLPNPVNGHFIVTTRRTGVDIGAKLNLEVFSVDEGISFLKNRVPNYGKVSDFPFTDFHEKAHILVERLGNLPLALEQAGAYIAKVKCSISKYIILLEESGLDAFEHTEEYAKPEYYEKVITTTWQISFDTLSNEGARQLFNLCAYMAPDKIPVRFFVEMKDKLPSPLREDLSKEIKANRVITELREYSLASGNNELINIHRLVQEVVRRKHKEDEYI
jgi:predicted phosphodiesterase